MSRDTLGMGNFQIFTNPSVILFIEFMVTGNETYVYRLTLYFKEIKLLECPLVKVIIQIKYSLNGQYITVIFSDKLKENYLNGSPFFFRRKRLFVCVWTLRKLT